MGGVLVHAQATTTGPPNVICIIAMLTIIIPKLL
jgi:hypothetical protein